jgi:ribonuclease R
MTERFSSQVLRHVADGRYQPRRIRELADELGIDADEFPAFRATVEKLVDNGEVVLGASDTVTLPPPGRSMIGTFRLHERGFGFVVPDTDKRHGHGDLFIPPPYTGDAMTGDSVRVKVVHEPGRGKATGKSPYTGRVIEIIKRADKQYVGNLVKQGSQWLVKVDARVMHDPVIIRDPHAKNASEGDKVVIELVRYPTDDEAAEGVIIEVLGEKGEPQVETLAVMRARGLVEHFSDRIMDEARAASRQFDGKAIPPGREDLTEAFICTIDPPDAKDFDDAISIRKLDDGGYELGVHIADVSHFVKLDGELDTEAKQRGNSTYLPRKVIPMLPEMLSNGVCSLQEQVNRFTKSVFITYDRKGHVQSQRFANAVIRSAKRLTYLEAQALIDGDVREARKHCVAEAKYPSQLAPALKLMDELAKKIQKRRTARGSIVLDLPEVELVFDESGRVIDAEREDDAFTHTLIEMLMVEANEAAAELFDKINVPMIRRIHPDPDAHDMSDLRMFARVAGHNIPAHPSRKELQDLLESVRGKPAQQAVHFAVLRTLSKAEYSPQTIGHFALASDHYTHFTSPIRRYADLVVHRALDAYMDAYPDHRKRLLPGGRDRDKLRRKVQRDPRVPDEQTLVELGRLISATERNSEAAERDLREYLVLELLAGHLGDDFDATITGMTGQGVFMQLDKYLVDGFIRVSELPGPADERWKLNSATGSLVAQRSGRSLTIGDRFTVRIANVNPQGRQMDLVIIENAGAAPKKKKSRVQPRGARKSHQKTMKLKRHKGKRR